MKIGAPRFVDFGKAMEHSPDGKANLVAHGASDGVNRRYAFNSWITGDEIYLARVTPSVENMNDATKYEFFAGNDATGEPVWTRDFARIMPTATGRDNMGCVTMTYNAPLKQFLLCVTDGTKTVTRFNTYILDGHCEFHAPGLSKCSKLPKIVSVSQRKSNQTDWKDMPGSPVERADMIGTPLQVGLYHASYGGDSRHVTFSDFRLTSRN